MANVPAKNTPQATNQAQSAGEEFILIDEQKNAAAEQSYWHVIKKITGQDGVQNGARLEFSFDPAYQHLTIHMVRITRDGQSIDRLEPKKFKIIQQETELDRHMFNGELSAVLFLEGVRVGDVIEYSSTVTGANPILKKHLLESAVFQWSVPVQRQYHRLLWPAGKAITIKNHQTDEQPVIHKLDGFTEYIWDIPPTPATVDEDSVPTYIEDSGWAQVTDFSSWREVAEWALPLYEQASALPQNSELLKKIEQWKALPTPQERIGHALRFVQDEVRYLGIEIGPGSHQPNPPADVFDHRFGDCKDKATLFCSIMKGLGVEAAPVLVNSYRRKAVGDWAPSPFAFNHVVAQIKLAGRTLWFDPTYSYQRGDLDDLYFPNYGYGLVVAPGTDRLVEAKMQNGELRLTSVQETFRAITYTNPTLFEVKTIKRGADADDFREDLAKITRDELQKSYLNHYAADYPKISVASPIDIRDDESKNEIIIIETYRIPDPWELSDDKKKWNLDLYPELIRDDVQLPKTTLRTLPLWQSYPRHVTQSTRVILAGPSHFKNESTHLEDKYIKFERNVGFSAPELTITYSLNTLTNEVAVADVPEHLALMKQIREKSYFQIERPNSTTTETGSRPNWLILVLGAFFLVFALAGALAAYLFRPKNPHPPLLHPDPALTGIRGWLVLIVIRLAVGLITVTYQLVHDSAAYSSASWDALVTPDGAAYNANWGPLLVFELLSKLTLLVFSPLLLLLMFQKRYAFRPYLIVYLAITSLQPLIDHFWLVSFYTSTSTHSRNPSALIGQAIFGLVWISYVLQSQRVKNTFTR